MNKKYEDFLKDALIRAIKTMAQTALSMITIGQAVIDVNWLNVLSVSAVAGLYSMLTTISNIPTSKEIALIKGKEEKENAGE